jgi:hypothetical protein
LAVRISFTNSFKCCNTPRHQSKTVPERRRGRTNSTTATLTWDETNFTTGVAIVNPSAVAATVTITVRDTNGLIIGSSSLALSAKSKMAAALRNLPGLGGMPGNRGSADFTVSSGSVAVLGLRFGPTAFTSIPTAQR